MKDKIVKSRSIRVRLTPNEERLFRLAASREGLSLSAFLRLAAKDRVRKIV